MATCNVQTLLANAACFECVSPGMWEVLELQLLCEILNAPGGGGGSAKLYTSQLYPVLSTQPLFQITATHGLGGIPQIVRVVAVCTAADANWGTNPGAEIDAALISYSGNPTPPEAPMLQVQADATTINVGLGGNGVGFHPQGGAEASFLMTLPLSGDTDNPTDWTNFSFKIYAVKF